MTLSGMANQAHPLHCHHPSRLEGEIGGGGEELCAAEGIVQQHHLRKRLLEVREALGIEQLIEIEVKDRPDPFPHAEEVVQLAQHLGSAGVGLPQLVLLRLKGSQRLLQPSWAPVVKAVVPPCST